LAITRDLASRSPAPSLKPMTVACPPNLALTEHRVPV